MNFDQWLQKIDARGRLIIDHLDAEAELDALARTTRLLEARDRDELLKTGCTIHTESGTVLTIRLRKREMEAVARLAFIHRIECSRPLHVEPTD